MGQRGSKSPRAYLIIFILLLKKLYTSSYHTDCYKDFTRILYKENKSTITGDYVSQGMEEICRYTWKRRMTASLLWMS